MTRSLVIEQPFDLALTLEMGQTFRWRRRGDVGEDWYSGVLGPHLVHIRQTGDGVEYRVGGTDGELENIDLSRALHDYFRLGDDIEAIYTELRRDPVVARAVEQYAGLRLLRQEPWECLVSYVCSRVKSIRGIRSSVKAIATLSRDTVRLEGDVRHVFPAAQLLAGRESDALSELPLGLKKAPDILRIARWLAHDPQALDRMAEPSASTADVVRRLEGFPGVGPKIASCAALMSLDRLDAFPVDRWVQRALAGCDLSEMPRGLAEKVKSPDALSKPQQYQAAEWARERFGRYAGYAGQYLFHWVEPHK